MKAALAIAVTFSSAGYADLFWTTTGTTSVPGGVWRANDDGSNARRIWTATVGNDARGITADEATGRLLWTTEGGSIYSSLADGSGLTDIAPAGTESIDDVAVMDGQVFVALRNSLPPFGWGVHRMNSDGTGLTQIASGTNIGSVATANGRVFWFEEAGGELTIGSANADATDVQILSVDPVVGNYIDLAVGADSGSIYLSGLADSSTGFQGIFRRDAGDPLSSQERLVNAPGFESGLFVSEADDLLVWGTRFAGGNAHGIYTSALDGSGRVRLVGTDVLGSENVWDVVVSDIPTPGTLAIAGLCVIGGSRRRRW